MAVPSLFPRIFAPPPPPPPPYLLLPTLPVTVAPGNGTGALPSTVPRLLSRERACYITHQPTSRVREREIEREEREREREGFPKPRSFQPPRVLLQYYTRVPLCSACRLWYSCHWLGTTVPKPQQDDTTIQQRTYHVQGSCTRRGKSECYSIPGSITRLSLSSQLAQL